MSETDQPNPFADLTTDSDTDYDEYGIDSATKNYGKRGSCDPRKAEIIREANCPPHVLAELGMETPGNAYRPDQAREYPTTVVCESDTEDVRVHLHQDVVEDMDNAFGDLGPAEDDTDDVVWTVVGLDNGTVDLTVVGDWGKRRSIEYSEFAEDYEPQFLADGAPKFGY